MSSSSLLFRSRASARFLHRNLFYNRTISRALHQTNSSPPGRSEKVEFSSSSPHGSSKFVKVAAGIAIVGAGVGAYSVFTKSNTPDKPIYGSNADFKKALRELQEKLGDDQVSTDESDLQQHGYSEWSSVNAERLPVAIAYPRSTEDVSEIAKVCHKYRLPMNPYSGGSSLEANFAAPYGGVTIDFMAMDQIINLHEEDMDVVVQPSIQWQELNQKLEHTNLFFPVDPGPSAKIGGMVGTNCSGTNAMHYGTMKDWVINLTVVLADGRVIKTRRRPRKTSAGYNLTGLFVGSEGTLGLVTEITLKLSPIPENTRVGVVTFSDIGKAATAASKMIRRGIPVQCMELMDDVQMSVVNRAGGTSRVWKELPTLFFKFSGTKGQVADSINQTKETIQPFADTFEFAKDEDEAHTLWSARKEALWSMIALGDEGSSVWTTDVAVPISSLREIIGIETSKKEIDDLGVFAGVIGHIGDGNFHGFILHNRNDPDEQKRVEQCVHNMVERALEMDGSCTGEHGIGMGKKDFLLRELGYDTVDVMRNLKLALDPHWLLNPGKIFDFKN